MQKKWWHDKIVYQIYPKSFYDTDGDGVGDLPGVITKLDYLQELGVDLIWLSPIYRSPFVDQGYDISDYYSIAEQFGTMDDFDALLAEAKKRGMGVVMDLVVNHCSEQHEWFQKALAEPYGPYADYFYFEKGRGGGVPSNYRACFGGSTWQPVPGTDLYYLHFFAKEQPDLNWENPALRREIYNMVNWWLDKGLAGFRIDAIVNIKKDTSFPCYAPDGADGLVSFARMAQEVEGIGAFLRELRRETFDKYDAFTVAEATTMSTQRLREYIGEDGYFGTMFDFSANELAAGKNGWYDAPVLHTADWRDAIFAAQLQAQPVGFLSNIIENHDQPRGASRFLPAHAQNDAGKKMLAATGMLLRGIPFIYQGQEIGMTNCRRTDIAQYDDISTIDQYRAALRAGCTVQQALDCCYANSRDNARTPMQWTSEAQAGFTSGTPWLAVNPEYVHINVRQQQADENSVLQYYKRLIALRKSPAYKDILVYGSFTPAFTQEAETVAYYRTDEQSGRTVLVAGNYGAAPCTLPLPRRVQKTLLANLAGKQYDGQTQLTLQSCESAVVLLADEESIIAK